MVAFASRHDKHPMKHYVLPGLGALMNIAELLGVIYIAVNGSGTTPGDAYKALGVVVRLVRDRCDLGGGEPVGQARSGPAQGAGRGEDARIGLSGQLADSAPSTGAGRTGPSLWRDRVVNAVSRRCGALPSSARRADRASRCR